MHNPQIKPVCFRIPQDVLEKLQEAKWIERKSMTEIVVQALREYCLRHNIADSQEEPPSLPEQTIPLDGVWRQ